jgi:xylulokinase
MNLWDIPNQRWSDQLLKIVGGNSNDLRSKLGEVADGGAHLGPIDSYFVNRYGFHKGTPNRGMTLI